MKLSEVLNLAVQRGASDVHINGGDVFFKLLGQFTRQNITIQDDLSAIHDMSFLKNPNSSRHPNDRSVTLELGGVRARFSYYDSIGGPCLSARILPDTIPTLSSLNTPAAVQNLLSQRQGFVMICGATGSGRTTTIAGMINHVNSRDSRHIIMLEDPIEFIHTSNRSVISQREIGVHTHSLEVALKSITRQNPDIVVIGEIVNVHVLNEAIRIAANGHMVITSFDANSCSGAILRVMSMCDDDVRGRLSDCLAAIITQRLLVVDSKITPDFEIVLGTPEIRRAIRDNSTYQVDSYIASGDAPGMQRFQLS